MCERFKQTVLKTVIPQGIGGSNPPASAMNTFVFDLEEPLSEANEKLLSNFGVRKIDVRTIEMMVRLGETLDDAIVALGRLGIRVQNVHND